MTMLHWALQAQSRGLWIFPVAARDKVPHRLAGQWGATATNDPDRIGHFWTNIDPNANIGVACKPSGLLVVDLDRAKEDWNLRNTEYAYMHEAYGPRVHGEEVLDEMRFHNEKPGDPHPFDTHTVTTGSGGQHLYYRWPDGWPKTSQASPVKGVVDVRGNGGQWGGYVLGEGSVTAAGGYVNDVAGPPILPPRWIAEMVVEKPKVQTPKRSPSLRQPSATSWSGLVASVRNAGEGNRNNALCWAARAMCSDGASEQECKDTLGPAAQDAGLPYHEIERTIESSYRIQQQKDGMR